MPSRGSLGLAALALIAVSLVFAGCGGGGGGSTPAVTVSFTTPAAGARNVSQGSPVTLAVTATAKSTGVNHVVFTCNGVTLPNGSVSASPYQVTWDTTGYVSGAYLIVATAYDNSNPAHSATSSISVTVLGTSVSVAFTAPVVAKRTVSQGATVTCTVTASAPAPHAIQRVEFYADGASLGVVNAAPYTVKWSSSGATLGAHTLIAQAYDNEATPVLGSASITITVATPNTLPPTVDITAPASGATLSWNAIIHFTATAQTAGATITKVVVTFGSMTKTVTGGAATLTSTATFDTTALADGNYSMQVQATDSNGRFGSANVVVAVANSISPPPPPW